MPVALRTLNRCVCDPRPGVFLRRRWVENGVCAFKALDCLSLCAAERLTPSGHSGHLSGGRTHHPGEVQRENNPGPPWKRKVVNLLTAPW